MFIEVYTTVRVVVCVYRSVVNVSVMVCTQLVVSGDVCTIQLLGWWWCVFIEVTQLFVWWCVHNYLCGGVCL